MNKSRVAVPKMDCAAEERLVRMVIETDPAVRRVDADLVSRAIDVYHDGPADAVLRLLEPLKFGARLLDTGVVSDDVVETSRPGAEEERRTLWLALGINGAMFLGEAITGYLADSSGLIADSLDMFADAAVYGIALYGVGKATSDQRQAARFSGWLQLLLGLGALFEVARRAVGGSDPGSTLMIGVAVVALVANATTMWLLAAHRQSGVHMKASWIFTTNDVLANCGVIVAGLLVRVTDSSIPDLAIGAIIALVVLSGAIRIMRL